MHRENHRIIRCGDHARYVYLGPQAGSHRPMTADEAMFHAMADKIETMREMLTELANLGVPQNGRGCIYCGTKTAVHKDVCEVPEILALLRH